MGRSSSSPPGKASLVRFESSVEVDPTLTSARFPQLLHFWVHVESGCVTTTLVFQEGLTRFVLDCF